MELKIKNAYSPMKSTILINKSESVQTLVKPIPKTLSQP